jgi:hypothetical protein
MPDEGRREDSPSVPKIDVQMFFDLEQIDVSASERVAQAIEQAVREELAKGSEEDLKELPDPLHLGIVPSSKPYRPPWDEQPPAPDDFPWNEDPNKAPWWIPPWDRQLPENPGDIH